MMQMMNLITDMNQRQQGQEGIVTSMLNWIHYQATTGPTTPAESAGPTAAVGFTAGAAGGPPSGKAAGAAPSTPAGHRTTGGAPSPSQVGGTATPKAGMPPQPTPTTVQPGQGTPPGWGQPIIITSPTVPASAEPAAW
eukprot:9474582-Pyramimonas_sp.AAC.1